MVDIYGFLKNHGINYERFDHPAVFTCQDADALCPTMPGKSIKNIFLHDKKSEKFFLLVVGSEKRLDLKHLKNLLEASRLSFCSPDKLQQYLGVDPGSVTILGLINDQNHSVNVLFDNEIWGYPLQCHPLVNTATLVIPSNEIIRFLNITGHGYRIIDCLEKLD